MEEFREALAEIASNFAFSWLPEARALFERLDADTFARVDRNPVALVQEISHETLERAAADEGLRADVERVRDAIRAEREAPVRIELDDDLLVAYFSLEFGLDDSLRIYSGGLGVLAGDHLKSASELGVPLVGVGLLYRHGYFRQGIDASGWQLERYPEGDPFRLPLTLERGEDGTPLLVRVNLAGQPVYLRIWRAGVGRVPLYLLDADIDENRPDTRLVTGALYGGDRELRIKQELLLGVGGSRALTALGLAPTVFHMNEGHAAFLALERIRVQLEQGVSLDDAIALVRASTVFTTHTPVPAGNEVFDPELVRRYLEPRVTGVGFDWEAFVSLGRAHDGDPGFGMTPLALRTSSRANGVSELHGAVSRRMWQPLWPDTPVDEVPVGHVTNGVHARTWLSTELQALLDANGVRPAEAPSQQRWDRVAQIGEDDLWRVHMARKRALGEAVATRAHRFVDPDALTVGFARRFATYKRAWLLFSDPERIARLLSDPDRPMQIIVAGKAHPQDDAGKAVIRAVLAASRELRAEGRVVFVEDYDMELARHLVSGVDVWLNTPRRPMEASGTSGMKAGMNGVLNCSVLDGWWPEAYAPGLGWAIGEGFESPDEAEQDAHDRESLFRILEQEVVPTFYDLDVGGLPTRWTEMMKASIETIGARFNTHRMVCEYAERYYLPAHREARELSVRS
ncbi:MAG: alpha-glucan family phosphorylase [Gaiellaceae bacterium]